MTRPLVIPAAGLTAGIIAAYTFNINGWLLIGCGAAVVIAMIFPAKRSQFGLIPIIIFFPIIGAILTNNTLESFPDIENDRMIQLVGIVEDINRSEMSDSFVVKIDTIGGIETSGKMLIKFYQKDPYIDIGEKVYVQGKATIVFPNSNPGFFNYQTYLKTKGISHVINGDKSEVISLGYSKSSGYWIKRNAVEYISNVFDEGLQANNADFMKGLLLGDSGYLDDEEYLIYKDMGLAHLLAVSGLHIGIIAGGIIYILSRLGVNRRINVAISVSFIIAYGYVIGFPPSAARGIIMFTFLYAARLIHKPADSLNILLASFCISLIFNPLWILSSGFQLSYSAAASLILLSDRIKSLFYSHKGRLIDGISAVLSVNLGILPIQVYLFNRLPLIAIVSNLIIVPLATASLVLGMISLAANWLLPILDSLLNIQRGIAYLTASIPSGVLNLPTPTISEAVIYLFLLAVAFNWTIITSLESTNKKVLLAFLVLSVICEAGTLFEDRPVEIDFVDVGQGDCALIKTSEGNYLIDAGGSLLGDYDVGEKVTLPYLEKQGIKKLDAVFISHRHEDHYEGLFPVVDEIDIGVIFINDNPPVELSAKAAEKGIPIIKVHDDNSVEISRNLSMRILWPQNNGLEYLNENNNSIVLLLEMGRRKILFTGDIETEVEDILLSQYSFDVDILKVAHHGSGTSTSTDFVRRFSPEYSIISVGRNNMFGHPEDGVIERLEEFGSKVYRTDEMGRIRAEIFRDEITIEPFINNTGKMDIGRFLTTKLHLIGFIFGYLFISIYLVLAYNRGKVRSGGFGEL
jgi:competence protein ComEC